MLGVCHGYVWEKKKGERLRWKLDISDDYTREEKMGSFFGCNREAPLMHVRTRALVGLRRERGRERNVGPRRDWNAQ